MESEDCYELRKRMAKEEVYELRITKNTGFVINETGSSSPIRKRGHCEFPMPNQMLQTDTKDTRLSTALGHEFHRSGKEVRQQQWSLAK
jgi:hypothetical protein